MSLIVTKHVTFTVMLKCGLLYCKLTMGSC